MNKTTSAVNLLFKQKINPFASPDKIIEKLQQKIPIEVTNLKYNYNNFIQKQQHLKNHKLTSSPLKQITPYFQDGPSIRKRFQVRTKSEILNNKSISNLINNKKCIHKADLQKATNTNSIKKFEFGKSLTCFEITRDIDLRFGNNDRK